MTTWAYRFELNHPGAGVGTIYYAEAYFDLKDIVNPASAEAYTDSEIEAIKANADENTMDVPAGALLGMSTLDHAKSFWYDEENATKILASASPLVLNDNGNVTDSAGKVTAVAMR